MLTLQPENFPPYFGDVIKLTVTEGRITIGGRECARWLVSKGQAWCRLRIRQPITHDDDIVRA